MGARLPLRLRPALARGGALPGSLTRIFEQTVRAFYARRAGEERYLEAKTGSVTVLQLVSSDLRLNPHVHAVFLDGAWHDRKEEAPERIPHMGGASRAHLRANPLACPACQGRLRLVAVLRDPARIARHLASIGEPTELPARSPSRGPPYWKSRVLRRMATGHDQG